MRIGSGPVGLRQATNHAINRTQLLSSPTFKKSRSRPRYPPGRGRGSSAIPLERRNFMLDEASTCHPDEFISTTLHFGFGQIKVNGSVEFHDTETHAVKRAFEFGLSLKQLKDILER
jgi:hypothetical protein